jgi:hypothetical protein
MHVNLIAYNCYRPRKTGIQKFSDIKNIPLTGPFLSPKVDTGKIPAVLCHGLDRKARD